MKKNINPIKFSEQETEYTCGPACMRMILSSLNLNKSEKQLVKELRTNKVSGTKHKNLFRFAKKKKWSYVIGNNAYLDELKNLMKKDYFIIVDYYIPSQKTNHYSIIKKITKERIYLIDPYFGVGTSYSLSYFDKIWNHISKYEKERSWFIAIKK